MASSMEQMNGRNSYKPRAFVTDEDYDDTTVNEEPSISHYHDCSLPPEPLVSQIIYWRRPFRTLGLLAVLLSLQLALLCLSVIAVIAWGGLIIMVLSACYRAYAYVFVGKQKAPISLGSDPMRARTSQSETFSKALTFVYNTFIPHQYYYLHSCEDTHCPNESFFPDDSEDDHRPDEFATKILKFAHNFLIATRELLLLKRPVQSIKLAGILYVLTRVGAYFNFSTLLLTSTVVTFSIPKLYDMYKVVIHKGISKVTTILRDKKKMVQNTLAGLPVVGSCFGPVEKMD